MLFVAVLAKILIKFLVTTYEKLSGYISLQIVTLSQSIIPLTLALLAKY